MKGLKYGGSITDHNGVKIFGSDENETYVIELSWSQYRKIKFLEECD